MPVNFIVGPDGQIYPSFDPNQLPVLSPKAPPYLNAAGAADDFYTGPGAQNGFTMGPGTIQDVSNQMPTLAGQNLPPRSPGTGFTMGEDTTIPYGQFSTVNPNQKLLPAPNPPAVEEAMPGLEEAEAVAPTLAGRALGAAGRLAGKVALPIGLFMGTKDYAKAQQNPPIVNPNDPTGTQIMGTMLGGENPNWSQGANMAVHLLSSPGIAGAQMLKDTGADAQGLWDWATIPEKDRPEAGKIAGEEGISPVEAWARMRKDSQEPDTTGESKVYDTGINLPQRPPMPQMQSPVGMDTSELQKWLAAAEPKAPNADAQQREMQYNILGGLAKGLANSTRGYHTGFGTLADLGAGAAEGAAAGGMQQEKENQLYDQAQQHYAQMRAGQAIDLASMDANQKNAVANVAFKNAMLQHQDALEGIAQGQPKFMGMKGGTALYQMVGPNGQIQLKTYDTGNLKKQNIAKVFANNSAGGTGGHGGDVVRDLMAADIQPMNDPFGYFMMTANELQNKGVLSNVLGDKQYQAIDTAARNQTMTMPGDEKSKGQAYRQALLGQAAGVLMNNRNILGSAAPYSIFAQGLYPYLNNQGNQ